jgi:hypothetical protein
MSRETLEAWGWRLAFLIAIPLLAVGLFRRGVEESPALQAAQSERKAQPRSSLPRR